MMIRRWALFLLLGSSALAAAPVKTDPQVEVIAHLNEAEFALQAERLDDAAKHYLSAALVADDAALAERATALALASGQRDLARTALTRWRALAPDALPMHVQSLAMALEDGEHETAMVEARFLLGRQGGDGWPQLLRALANARGDARIIARAVLADLRHEPAMPARFQSWLAFASLAQKMGDQDAANGLVDEALRRFPDDPDARQIQAIRLIRADDKPALAVFQREVLALAEHAAPAYALVLGQVAEALEQWPQAESWYRQVLGERAALAQQRLAWVLHQQARDADALTVLHALQRDTQTDGEQMRAAFLMEAQLQALSRRDAEVLDAYRRGLAVFEDDPLLLYSRAMYQESQGRVDQALADLHRVIDLDGENAAALNAYGYTLMERRQRYEDALPYVEKAYALDAESPAILDSIGWLRFRMGRLNDALPLLQKAWAGEKGAEIAAHLGEVLWQLGRKDEARAIWGDGWAREPGHPALQPMRGRMR